MPKDDNVLSEKKIRDCLEKDTDIKEIIVLNEVNSTNSYAKELANNGKGNTVVIANSQTNGRGRLGRNFTSPASNGIYMSIIIRSDISLSISSLMTPCIAVAVAEAIESVCSCDVKIKWVNDLFLNERKICGILTETSVNRGKLDYAVVGIGINVRKSEFPDELRDIATSLESETGQKIDRNILCGVIIQSIEKHMRNLEKREFMEEYRRRSFIIGKKVLIGGMESVATACGIDDYARLIVKLDDDTKVAVNFGEARIIK